MSRNVGVTSPLNIVPEYASEFLATSYTSINFSLDVMLLEYRKQMCFLFLGYVKVSDIQISNIVRAQQEHPTLTSCSTTFERTDQSASGSRSFRGREIYPIAKGPRGCVLWCLILTSCHDFEYSLEPQPCSFLQVRDMKDNHSSETKVDAKTI